jgi:hypothetical protein
LSANCSIRSSIVIIVLSSLSLVGLFTSLFWRLYGGINNCSLFVSLDIFFGSFFPLGYRAWLMLAFCPHDAFFVRDFANWKNFIQPFF